MSYPSIKDADPTVMTPQEQEEALWNAFHTDLPLGMAAIAADAEEVARTGRRTLVIEDPNSPLGKQLTRLLGTDVARGILEKRLGVSFGLYNCCVRVTARSRSELAMNMAEQIKLQNGAMASADC